LAAWCAPSAHASREASLLDALASVPDFHRYGALIAGFIVFMLTRRSIFAGVVSGEVVMLVGKWWLG
jgi:hypothetical protein